MPTDCSDDSEPTWMDAVVFSYLHVILHIPAVTKPDVTTEEKKQAAALRNLVLQHKNLGRYAAHIRNQYLKQ
jgi:metaxin